MGEVGGVEEGAGEVGVGEAVGVGGVGEDEVEGWFGVLGEIGEGFEDVALAEGGVLEACFLEIGTEDVGGGAVLFDEECGGGAAAEGFDSEGAGACEEVEDAGVLDVIAEHGEEGFPDAIGGGAGVALGDFEGDASSGSGDDAHGRRGGGAGLAAAFFVEVGDGACGFAVHGFAFEVLALVTLGFAFANADFDFHEGAFPVGAEGGEGEAFLLGEDGEFLDLALVEEEFAGAARFVLGVAGFVVGLDVEVVEPSLAALDAGEGVGEVDFALADGLDFGAAQFDTGFVAFEDMEVPSGFSIGGDFGRHESSAVGK